MRMWCAGGAVAAAAALVCAACVGCSSGGTTPGVPSVGTQSGSASDSQSAPGTPAAPSSTPGEPATGPATGTTTGFCVSDADYCDEFNDPGSGWPQENPAHYFAGYDNYQGGTYRMGERTNAAISEDAPFDVTEAANDYSVQLDVDATLAASFDPKGEIGFVCWEHPIEGGNGTTSAFLLEIGLQNATIGLWDDATGKYHELASEPVVDVLRTAGTNHLTGRCIQGTANGSAQAELSLSLDGSILVATTYQKSVQNQEWSVGKRVGLLAIGQGSDVFYDNFSVTGKCEGDFC